MNFISRVFDGFASYLRWRVPQQLRCSYFIYCSCSDFFYLVYILNVFDGFASYLRWCVPCKCFCNKLFYLVYILKVFDGFASYLRWRVPQQLWFSCFIYCKCSCNDFFYFVLNVHSLIESCLVSKNLCLKDYWTWIRLMISWIGLYNSQEKYKLFLQNEAIEAHPRIQQ